MRCAVYCRLSKEDPQSESIQNQKNILTRYALRQGWEVYQFYCDEDFSGADSARPDFCRMLHDAQARRFEIILCKTQSRFTRDMELVEKYIHGLFPLWGIRFVAVADNVDTALRGNKKARQINGLINEWYLEDLSENVRMVLEHKRRSGQYVGSIPLYGYKKDPADRHRLIIDEPTAAVVRRIYGWFLSGIGTQRITAMLNDAGIDNPTAYKKPDTASSRLWSKSTVSRILHNEMYAGVLIQGRRKRASYKSKRSVRVPEAQWARVEGAHAAIVSPEDFHQVQTLLAAHTRSDGLGRRHPLSGLAYCACGKPLMRTTNGAGRRYLHCPECAHSGIGLNAVEELVRGRLRGHVERLNLPPSAAAPDPWLSRLRRELERRDAAIRTLYLDRASDLITVSQFDEMNRAFLAERDRLEAQINQLPDRSEPSALPLDSLLPFALSRVEVEPKHRGTPRQIRLFWRF